MRKRFVSLILVFCMVLTCVVSAGISASAADTPVNYGLGKTCKDGNILQCFNWTLAQIKAELPNIAAAGFTSVQTSPLQTHNGKNNWYWLYQPNGFTLGNEIGSYEELKSLCAEADKYGVKIIVDVVANHVAGDKYGNISSSVENIFKTNKSTYFHNKGECTNYNVRTDVIYKNIGMPDLNTENKAIQDMAAAMVQKLIDAGVDGIRWDAAKHIGLPSENCAFWSRMAQFDIYQYGEILDAPAGSSADSVNDALMQEYAKYISVTDDKYSTSFRGYVKNGSRVRNDGYWNKHGITSDKLVYWAESHDTFANDGGETKTMDQSVIDKTYAILGARADSQALYLSRPPKTDHQSIYYGVKGSTHFTSKEVAAVNHFHNAMVGTGESFSTDSGCYVVWRDKGAVLVSQRSADVDVNVKNDGGRVPAGTYTDEITGNTWTVTETTISGHIGSSGIAVVYNPEPAVDVLVGDTNLNEEVEIDDATLIQRCEAKMITLTETEQFAADVDFDDKVTVMDATAVQWYLAQMSYKGSHVGETRSTG